MIAANTGGDVLKAKLGRAGGEHEDEKEKERTEHEEAGWNGLKSGMENHANTAEAIVVDGGDQSWLKS
jgi:hypothetical protein